MLKMNSICTLDNYVIVFYSKGMERVLHTSYFNGRYYRAHGHAEELRKTAVKDAWYYDILTEKEYKAKFE
jgi:hypothetical protein